MSTSSALPRVVEDVAQVEQGCRALTGTHDTIQDDVETLISIYNEKGELGTGRSERAGTACLSSGSPRVPQVKSSAPSRGHPNPEVPPWGRSQEAGPPADAV